MKKTQKVVTNILIFLAFIGMLALTLVAVGVVVYGAISIWGMIF